MTSNANYKSIARKSRIGHRRTKVRLARAVKFANEIRQRSADATHYRHSRMVSLSFYTFYYNTIIVYRPTGSTSPIVVQSFYASFYCTLLILSH